MQTTIVREMWRKQTFGITVVKYICHYPRRQRYLPVPSESAHIALLIILQNINVVQVVKLCAAVLRQLDKGARLQIDAWA